MYTGLFGVTTKQRILRRQRLPAGALNARQSAQKSGTPMLAHRTLYSAVKVYKELERMLKVSEIKMSVDKVLALA